MSSFFRLPAVLFLSRGVSISGCSTFCVELRSFLRVSFQMPMKDGYERIMSWAFDYVIKRSDRVDRLRSCSTLQVVFTRLQQKWRKQVNSTLPANPRIQILKEKGSWPQEMLDTLKDFLRWERVIRPVDRSPIGDLVPV
ncbi:hypothetical protein RB195_016015 [Necator americanus]|uniref:Uncharacterized protein n=1 Tax=Necator americanus TaxID=51031 RepID=A0ABR1E7U2_NECAM